MTALTPRQTLVVALVAEGRSNDEIGRELGMSVETVKTHIENVRARLDAANRAEAAARYAREDERAKLLAVRPRRRKRAQQAETLPW